MTTPPPAPRPRWIFHAGWIVPLLAVVAGYGALHDRGFTSEDFLLIRVLGERPPWEDLAALFTGPWLGIGVVEFYRPFALVLLGVEAALFGGDPSPYNVLHLGFHAINVLLVFDLSVSLVRSAGRDPLPAAPVAALLFAIHPLHPNAVAWIASYATLFAATGVLASAVAWEGWRRRGGGGLWLLSLAAWVFALGCYEAAVVLPAVLLLRELAARSRRAWGTLPFLAVAGLYLLFRRSLFGDVLGGYGAFADRFGWDAAGGLARDAALSLYQLFDPSLPAPTAARAAWLVVAALLSAPLLAWLLGRREGGREGRAQRGGGEAGRWFYAWLWMVLFLAPFAFQPFVPATGRFAYLAAVGTALALGQLAGLAAGAPGVPGPRPGEAPTRDPQLRKEGEEEAAGASGPRRVAGWILRLVVVAVLLGIAVRWGVGLQVHVAALDRAAATAAEVSGRLAVLEAPGGEATPLFVADHPRFVLGPSGIPLAQVLRYGLADSVQPPFRHPPAGAAAPRVHPLPEGGPADHAAAAAALAAVAPRGAFVAWDGEAGGFGPLPPAIGAPAPAALPLLRGPTAGDGGGAGDAGAADPGGEPSPAAASPPGSFAVATVPGGVLYRLVAVTRGNPVAVELPVGPEGAEGILPLEFLRSMHHLYGGESWWWVEARGAAGEVLAVTRARPWPPPGPDA